MLRSFLRFIRLLREQRHLIFSFARRELINQYVGSFLGIVWTFIHPLVMILVFWFVFSKGLRVQPMNDVPFVVWLTAGMAPWFVFSDILNSSAVSVLANANLIKKTLFPSEILPVIRIVCGLVIHGVFLVVLLGLIVFQRMPMSLYYFQFLYYLFCLCVLVCGLAWAVSALNVFVRDIAQIVGVFMQVGFWATPIFWPINIMPEQVQAMLKLNPMYYVVQGYRESFISFVPFWKHPGQTLYFWCFSLTVFAIGALVFQRLKPQFADVL